MQAVPPHLLRLLADGDILVFDVITTPLFDRHINNITWGRTALCQLTKFEHEANPTLLKEKEAFSG